MHELASYLPAYLRRRVEQDAATTRQFWSDELPATVMFADISGFTPLANRLAEVGPEGAELLARLLNVFYGRLVDMIYDHGGDVIAYAGDAAIAVWPAGPNGLSESITRTACCGLAIQEQLHNYSVAVDAWRNAPQAQLSVKVVIAAGTVRIVQLGGENGAWHPILLGAPLMEIATADGQMQPGDVVLTTQAAASAGDNLVGEPLAAGCFRVRALRQAPPRIPTALPRSTERSLAATQAYVPRAVLARMELGDSDWLADLRAGSVVFVKLCGIDVDAPDAPERLHQVTQTLQRVFARYEGSLVHLIQDDKGLVVVGCFGLPPLIHEDDAVRAIAAALAIEKKLAALGVEARIGITSGRLFSGPRGNDRRREYSITGQVANLAARLMGQASEGILCDHDSQVAARGRATFEAMPRLHLKGYATPVPVYRPLTVSPRATRRPRRMAGRVQELDSLLQVLAAAGRRQRQVLVLEGEAGVGKSTLVDELVRESAERDIDVLAGAADAVEASTPYFAWRPVVARLLKIDLRSAEAQRHERVLTELAFDPTLLERAALLNGILNLNLAESQLVAQLAGRARADNLHELIVRLLNRSSTDRPSVVVIEDTHWLDSASWRLLLAAVEQCPELSLVLSTRPLLVSETHEFSRLRKRSEARHIYVDVLVKDDALELVRERLAVSSISQRLGYFILERTQGNPFFIEELVNYLLEFALVETKSGVCDLAATLDSDDSANVPRSIRALITSRIDRLSVPEQLTAKTASVVGRSFQERTLVSVYPNERHRPQVVQHLRQFSRLHLIRLEREEPQRAFAFKHITIQQVTYDQIPQANRLALHRAIAAWYEAHEGRSPASFALLAHPYGRGDLVEKEIEYLAKAGEHALRGYANREAERAFRSAIERSNALGQDPGDPDTRRQLGHWHRQLGEALFQLGDIPQAEEHLYRALELFGSDNAGKAMFTRLRLLGQVARQVIHRLLPGATIRRQVVDANADSAGGLHETALALQRLSEVHYLKVDIVEGLGTSINALNVAERAGRSALLARAYASMTVVCGLLRRRRSAEHYARLAEDVARQIGDRPTTAYVLMAVGVNRLGTAKWSLVEQHAAESVHIAEQLQDNHQLALSLTVEAMLHCFRGNYLAAERLQGRIGGVAQATGNDVHLAWSHSGRGECRFRCGDTQAAIDELQQAQRLLDGKEHDTEEIRVAGLLAAAHWRAGDRTAATEAVRTTLELMDNCSHATVSMLEGYSGIVEVILLDRADVGAGGPLSELLPQAMSKLRWYAKVFPIGRPRWLCHRGTLHWLEGRPRWARRDWARSLCEATTMRLPLEQGLAHYQIGLHEERGTESHIKHLSCALDIFAELGVLAELELAKQALDVT